MSFVHSVEKHLIVRRSLLHTTSKKGFEYEKIRIFLDKFHGTIMWYLETSDLETSDLENSDPSKT